MNLLMITSLILIICVSSSTGKIIWETGIFPLHAVIFRNFLITMGCLISFENGYLLHDLYEEKIKESSSKKKKNNFSKRIIRKA